MAKQAKIAALAAELATAERRAAELKAQLASTLGAAFDDMGKAADFHGSGVIVSIVAIGGREIVRPVMIRDGLSPATVAALRADVCRSFELATLVSPAMATFHKESRS